MNNMKKLEWIAIKVALLLLSVSCVSAGGTLIKSYGGMHANEENIEKAIILFWQQNPENRINSSDIQKVEKYFPKIFNGFTFKDTLNGDTSVFVFQWNIKTKDIYQKFWYLKSSDGKIIFNIEITNCNPLTGNCDICLTDAMFLDKIENNFRNWELSSQEKKQVKSLFEKDILKKIKIIIEDN